MTLATITETLALPADGSSATLGQTRARLRLVAAVGGVATAYTTGLTAVVADAWETVATDGTYSFTGVRPNSGSSGDVITTPTGTVYELTVVYPDRTTLVRHISVPDSAGPHAPADIITADPTDITSYGYYLDKDDRIHGRPTTEPMRGFLAALSAVATAPVTVVVVGDSLSEDWQWVDSGISESVGLRSWVRLYEVELNERFHGGAYGVGWLPIRAGLGTNPGWDTVTGAAITTAGLGFYAVELEAAEYAEHTEVCDAVDLYVDSVGSTLQIRIDGSLVDTLTAEADPQVWSSGALTSGSHTVKVTAVGGTAKVYGSYWHSSTLTSGVQVHNGGHSGAGPLDHSTTRGTLEHIALVQPDLVIVPIGGAANNPPTVLGGGFDDGLVDYETNITDLLDAIATEAPAASIVHVAEHAFTTRATTWPPFAVVSRRMAFEHGWGFADCYETIGYTGSPDTHGLAIFDGTHLSGKGHRLMADTILQATVPATNRLTGFALADGSRGAFVPTEPAGSSATVTLLGGDGPSATFLELLTSIGLYLTRASDSTPRGMVTDSGVGWGDGTNAVDALIQRVAAGLLGVTGAFRFAEQTDPAAPAANQATLYCRDNGSGKTQLCVRFSSGAVQVIATEP